MSSFQEFRIELSHFLHYDQHCCLRDQHCFSWICLFITVMQGILAEHVSTHSPFTHLCVWHLTLGLSVLRHAGICKSTTILDYNCCTILPCLDCLNYNLSFWHHAELSFMNSKVCLPNRRMKAWIPGLMLHESVPVMFLQKIISNWQNSESSEASWSV